jgi:predicted ATPase
MMPYFLSVLAQACAGAGQVEEALSILAESQAALEETGERWWQAEIYRLKGELLLRHSTSTPEESHAEECFRLALETAREQGAKSLELRAMTSLSRIRQKKGKRAEARHMLAKVYSWFTEGFDTPDLRHANALIEQLR